MLPSLARMSCPRQSSSTGRPPARASNRFGRECTFFACPQKLERACRIICSSSLSNSMIIAASSASDRLLPLGHLRQRHQRACDICNQHCNDTSHDQRTVTCLHQIGQDPRNKDENEWNGGH